jgi:uncharacterized protein
MTRRSQYLSPLMSNALPDVVDAWRMVNARRIFVGQLPLAAMTRLADSLSDTQGDCRYQVEFGRDEFGVAFIGIEAETALPLICQRTLERFEFPVQISQRIGLIRDEREEAGLPPGYEPVLLDLDARMKPADLIEDELILAVPVVPVKPGTEAIDAQWSSAEAEDEEDVRPNPFAALSSLKASKPKQQ